MRNRLTDVYNELWSEPSEHELRIMELQESCADLERRLLALAETLPYESKALIESYIYNRAELELYSVTQAFKTGRKQGGHRDHFCIIR